MKFFLLVCTHMASTSNFSLVARLATLGDSGNLRKSKMAARHHLDNTILEVFIYLHLRFMQITGVSQCCQSGNQAEVQSAKNFIGKNISRLVIGYMYQNG